MRALAVMRGTATSQRDCGSGYARISAGLANGHDLDLQDVLDRDAQHDAQRQAPNELYHA